MGGCLSVEVIAESAPSSPFGNVTSTTPRSRAHSVASSPGGNQRYATGFSPRTPREAGDESEAEGNGAGGGGVAGGGGKFRRGAGRGKRVGSGVGGAKAVSSGGGRGGGGEGGEGGWGRGAERQGGAVGRGNGRGEGGDGYGGGGGLAAPQSVPVGNADGGTAAGGAPFPPLSWPFPSPPFPHPLLPPPPSAPLACQHVSSRGTLDPTPTNQLCRLVPPLSPHSLPPQTPPPLHQPTLLPSFAPSASPPQMPPPPTLQPFSCPQPRFFFPSFSPFPPTSDATSTNSAGLSAAQSMSSDGRGTARKFRLHELRTATSSFSKKAVLGRGSFGEVYLGKLGGKESREVVEVAVKKLNPESSQGLDEWLAEIVLLRKLHHPNLVELIGYCAEKGEALLVYGLCPNGSLDDRLFPRREVDIIDWPTRVRIAQGAAQGLLHLHENKVIHRDLKPSNILLDQDMQARITDFGMAKQSASSVSHISTRVMGTMGYLDPEYMETGCLRDKSDVYSLGVILLQMLTGRDAVSKEGNVKLVAWMGPHLYPNITEPEAWVDPNLQGRFSRRGAKMLAAVAKQCSARHKEDRPEMSDVAQALMSVPLAD
ncbi:unnamed protein product [Closterium sp. Naga37s-1]|nr:unnamed protein product [Closterium sp. Naga37s-1]